MDFSNLEFGEEVTSVIGEVGLEGVRRVYAYGGNCH